MKITCTCVDCGEPFTYDYTYGQKRKHCGENCKGKRVCKVCQKAKSVESFYLGRLTCKSCHSDNYRLKYPMKSGTVSFSCVDCGDLVTFEYVGRFAPNRKYCGKDCKGKKVCKKCKELKDVTSFRWQSYDNRYESTCKNCHYSSARFSNHGITKQEFTTLLTGQGNTCAICKTCPIGSK